MLTSNEQYMTSVKNWNSIVCPSQRAFASSTELPIKVGDSIVYRSGFKVYASATSTSVLISGQSQPATYIVVDSASSLVATGIVAAIASLMF